VSKRGRGQAGSKDYIVDQIIADGVDWRKMLVLNSESDDDGSKKYIPSDLIVKKVKKT